MSQRHVLTWINVFSRVTDGVHTAETDALIVVTLTDINDSPPVFEPSEYSTFITEDLSAESSVLTVTATDSDFSDVNHVIQYTLQDASVFVINSTSGIIYVGSPSSINYDDAPYELVVLAKDNGDHTNTATVTVTISVQTKPVWKQPSPGQSANKEIPEDTPFSTVVMILVAEDKDNSNIPLQYSIHRQDPVTPIVFVIEGNTVKTTSDAKFDVDSQNAFRSFSLYVRVTDGVYTADEDAVIEVTVTDVNDSPPVFDPSEYSTIITEDLSAGGSVLTVTATDADFTDANNKIEYSLDDTTFVIDKTSGIISVKSPSTVNYDDAPYEIVVMATDNGAPSNSASVTATIAVKTKPEWKDPAPGQSTIQQIAEDATDSTVILTLVAEDKDNSDVPLQYSIVSQVPATPVLFVVDGATLKPATDAKFDVDASDAVRLYSLTIRVSDGQYTAVADALLEITVTDVNDSPPSFGKLRYNVTIPENTQIGDTVIHVSAADDDYSSPNNVITYSLQADTDIFAVNMSDGRIILVKAPDRLEYVVAMTATDYGVPQLSAIVNVTIQIDADAVDECTNVVCLNEGTCQSSVNMFQCNCVAGWKGELCGTNIDDCTGSPCENEGACVDGINLFTCNCTEGWKGNTCTEVCSENKFGRNCEMGCQCDLAKVEASAVAESQVCDLRTGACKCKLTWTGYSCENDVDECENTTICAAFENKVCGNFDGGYKCGCTQGFIEDENNNDECVTDTDTTVVTVADNETKIDVSFSLNATREFNLHITLDYKNVKTEVEIRIKEIMPSVLRVIARSLTSGSLWVNLSLIVQDEAQTKIDTALKLQEIRDGLTFPLFAETVSTQTFLVEETPLPAKDPSDKSQQDVCEVYNAAFGCSTGEQCEIENGKPICEKIPKDNLPLILGLGLGILLPSILLIILIVVYVHIKYRHKLERTTKVRLKRRRYRDRDFHRRSDTNGYHSEDSQEPPYLFYTGDKEISTVSYTSSSIDHVPNGYLYDNKTIPMEW